MEIEELEFYTPHQVAELLRVSPLKVRRLCSSRKLPHFKFGRSVRINQKDVREYVEKNKVTI